MHDLDAISLADSSLDAPPPMRCDARVALIGSAVTIVAVIASAKAWFPLAVAVGCVAWLVTRRARLKSVCLRLSAPLTLVLVACVLKTFLTGVTPVISCELGSWRLTATREGLLDAALLAARVFGAVGMGTVLCQQTPAHELLAALRWVHVPRTWVEIAALMCRYLFALRDQAVTVHSAQQVRLGYAGLRQSFRSSGSLAGLVLLRCLDQADRTHEAMVARGFTGHLPLACLRPLRRGDWAILAAWTLAVVLAFLLLDGRLL
jgi:cobalt/nickel transport system permease protein